MSWLLRRTFFFVLHRGIGNRIQLPNEKWVIVFDRVNYETNIYYCSVSSSQCHESRSEAKVMRLTHVTRAWCFAYSTVTNANQLYWCNSYFMFRTSYAKYEFLLRQNRNDKCGGVILTFVKTMFCTFWIQFKYIKFHFWQQRSTTEPKIPCIESKRNCRH